MSSKRSDVWNHFADTNDNSKAKCVYCGQLVAVSRNSTGNLIRHLKKHPGVSTSRTTAVVETNYQTEQLHSETQRHFTEQPSTSSSSEPVFTSNSGSTRNTVNLNRCLPTRETISSYLIKPLTNKKSKEIDRQLVAMITKEYYPFSTVEDPEFKKFVHLLCPSYQLPTRKTLSTSLIPAHYNLARERVAERLKRAFAVCITVDGWTSRNNDGFYAMTAHYIVEDTNSTKIASDLVGCVSFTERHTSDNICSKIKSLLSEWNLDNKITVVVSDHAANMVASVRRGGWRHWGCFAHGLNLVVQNGLKEIETITKKIKIIVNFFRRSSHASSQLKATQERMGLPVLKLKTDVPTRWNSTFIMLRRILETKVAVITTLAMTGDRFFLSESNDNETIPTINNHEWQIAEQSIEVLEIFDVVTNVISAEKQVTASTIILFFKQINKHLRTLTERHDLLPEVKKLAESLQNLLKNRFENIEDNELLSQCTVLDPRYKKHGFINETKFKKTVQTLYTKVSTIKISSSDLERVVSEETQPTTSSDRREMILWKEFDEEVQKNQCPTNALASAIVEVDKYIDEPLLQRKLDPLLWWNQRKNIYPRLYQLMKTRLCILATSVPCERIFSKGGQVITDRRTRLDTKKIEEIMFLAVNLDNAD